jgi:hypothetical protein
MLIATTDHSSDGRLLPVATVLSQQCGSSDEPANHCHSGLWPDATAPIHSSETHEFAR